MKSMIDAISTLTAGLQKASTRVDQASRNIVNPQTPSASTSSGTATDLAAQTTNLTVQASETLSQGSLEASVVSLKVAANSYKANAEALSTILENQKESFDKLL